MTPLSMRPAWWRNSPHHLEVYARLGWTMFESIDRVYDSTKAAQRLGFVCRTAFGEKLNELVAELDGRALIRQV